MPESPRWLVYHGKYDEAYQVLKDVHSNGSDSELIAAEFKEIHDTINFEKENNGTWRALIAPSQWPHHVVSCTGLTWESRV